MAKKKKYKEKEVIALIEKALWVAPELIRTYPDGTVSEVRGKELEYYLKQWLGK